MKGLIFVQNSGARNESFMKRPLVIDCAKRSGKLFSSEISKKEFRCAWTISIIRTMAHFVNCLRSHMEFLSAWISETNRGRLKGRSRISQYSRIRVSFHRRFSAKPHLPWDAIRPRGLRRLRIVSFPWRESPVRGNEFVVTLSHGQSSKN
jgi:hypothetical protein